MSNKNIHASAFEQQVNPDPIEKVINQTVPKDDSQPLKLTVINMQSSSGDSSSSGSGGGQISTSLDNHSVQKETPQPNHSLTISDIVLTDTGESIVTGSPGNGSIKPAFNDSHIVSLTINGNFDTVPAQYPLPH